MLLSKLEGQLFLYFFLHTTVSVDTFPDVMRNTQKITNYFFGKVFYVGPASQTSLVNVHYEVTTLLHVLFLNPSLKYLPLFMLQPLCYRVYSNDLYYREVFITPFHWVEATRMEGLLADSPLLSGT